MTLMSMRLWINGQQFATIDTPENIGPWLARIMSVVKPGPGSSVRIEM